jgi:hypothetical protein
MSVPFCSPIADRLYRMPSQEAEVSSESRIVPLFDFPVGEAIKHQPCAPHLSIATLGEAPAAEAGLHATRIFRALKPTVFSNEV